MHFHRRTTPEACAAHLDGCGVTMANLLTQASAVDRVHAVQARYPKRFTWYASTDITKPGAEALLTQAVKDGAGGLGELKFHVDAEGPEFRRMYTLAAELDVPILIHFQEVPHTETEGVFAPGFKRFEAILKAYPKTKFFGHADAFWANVSADYNNQEAYPAGPIKRGGITDKLLSDYPNLFGDMSANSGNNALSRDPEFTPDFLKRHENKLVFGSDCGCTDGNGAGIGQANNPAANRLAGKCVARETLTVLQKSASAPLFKKLVWENAHKILQIPA
jgi:predicted TIM-barrel fold metal-dependent hydrolase